MKRYSLRWLMIALLLGPLVSLAASTREEVAALRQELHNVREELIRAVNETRVAYREDRKERQELLQRSGAELEAYADLIRQFQKRLTATEERLAIVQKQNDQLQTLIERHVTALQKLVAEESKQRVQADKRIVQELSRALEQGLTTIQAPAEQSPGATDGNGNYQTYEVVAGDTLSGIARAVGVSVQRLKEINNLENDVIRVGQKLQLPVP